MNAAETIARQYNMVSINSCISVDLYGQVNAESGPAAYQRGPMDSWIIGPAAATARGGKAFICMTSTHMDHDGVRRSRILPHFNGEIITNPRSQSYYTVTEFGAAVNLTYRTTWERAEMLSSASPIQISGMT